MADPKDDSKPDGTKTSLKLSLDRFVLAHFFLMFFISFVIGVVFLHSTMTFFSSATSEESILRALEGPRYDDHAEYRYLPPDSPRHHFVSLTLNATNLSSVR